MNARGAVALALVVVLAGCLGPLATYSSAPAAVESAAVDAGGYVAVGASTVPLVVPLYVGPVGGDVRVTGHLVVYARADAAGATGAEDAAAATAVDASEGDAVLFVLTTPDVEVLGLSANPFAHLSNQELLVAAIDAAATLNADYGVGDLADLRVADRTTRRILGTPVDVVTYDGTLVAADGSETAVRLLLATVPHEDDVVVLVGLHPPDDGRRESLLALMERVDHPVPPERAGPGIADAFGDLPNRTGVDVGNRTAPAVRGDAGPAIR
jgi:hypothetical protein